MNKIKIVSFYMARLFSIILVVLPIYILIQWIFVDGRFLLPYEVSPISTPAGMVRFDEIVWTSFSRFLASCAQLIGITPFLGILYCLMKVCRRYEVGEIFTMSNARSYYTIGKLLFFDALIAQPVSGGLWILAITLSNPVGQRYISITIGTPNLMAILTGLLVIFISWVMIEGTKIEEEQQLTI